MSTSKQTLMIIVATTLTVFVAAYVGARWGIKEREPRTLLETAKDIPDKVTKQSEIFSACEGEISTFCDPAQNASKIAACLLNNRSALTEECRAQAVRIGKVTIPCESDIERLCDSVPAGGARVYQCLLDSRQKLSKDCANVIPDLKNPAN